MRGTFVYGCSFSPIHAVKVSQCLRKLIMYENLWISSLGVWHGVWYSQQPVNPTFSHDKRKNPWTRGRITLSDVFLEQFK